MLVSEDLKFHGQVDSMCNRANFEINRIRRSFVTRSPKFLSNMFQMFVRPHLEYSVELWNPCYAGDIHKIERVQNKMSKLLKHGRILTPDERNKVLNLTSHQDRRKRGDLINMYKYISTGSRLFEFRTSDRDTRCNDKTLKVPLYRSNVKRHSFSYRSVREWNRLPNAVVNSETVNRFKTNYDAFLNNYI